MTSGSGSSTTTVATMPHVGMNLEHNGKTWTIIKTLASGPFSEVFEALDAETKQHYAMKTEKEVGTIRPVLKLDVFVLRMLQNRNPIGFPRIFDAGRTDNFKYVVMQLVGPDLSKLRRSLPDKKFSLITALRVCAQTLDRIETLHDMGWLCRDIKAPNFAIGRGEQAGIVYMLDFGFARRFLDNNGNHVRPRAAAAILGTIHYAPIASHFGREQSRRDDLESWFYMCVELLVGPLPWANLDCRRQHQLICEWKQFARKGGRHQFLKDCPLEFNNILSMIDALRYYERPNYRLIAAQIEKAIDRMKLDRYAPFDWQVDNGKIIEKAAFIGDLGESHLLSLKLREAQKKKSLEGNYDSAMEIST
ncbi:hypothetical protein QR680_018176 [Steinernema hermaphroditum]|uniref:Protein kinase domain-containing protein n=1 Tax=Steinernema hermaphroditum TaxID=289476 RepID=A0AA39HI16_9BILA|nr:hypothetical protein QR680_018176 [Steinernema hermaphroditum]